MNETLYYPSEMAEAILAINGTGGGTGRKYLPEEMAAAILSIPGGTADNCLTFSSPEAFTLAATSAQKSANPNYYQYYAKPWDGTLYYSADKENWNVWDGTTILSSGSDNKLYMRGVGNSVVAGTRKQYNIYGAWTVTGSNISIDGNIETLLDYQIVSGGEHPQMDDYCFMHLFENNASIIKPPSFPAIELSDSCYSGIFSGCTGLCVLPNLPATALIHECYLEMFKGCTGIKLSATNEGDYIYPYRIPCLGSGAAPNYSYPTYGMFNGTGGSFTGTPTINTTYYTDHEPVG